VGRLASVGFILLLAVLLEVAAPAVAIRSVGASPSAASFTLALVADRTSAGRNDTVTYSMWLNVTGGGQLQLARVNLTVEPDLVLEVNSSVAPAACGVLNSRTTFAAWQCSFLRAGQSYRWSVAAVVAANATLGRPRLATASAVELGGGTLSPRTAQVGVWIVLTVLALSVKASPSSTAQQGSRIDFNVTVANIAPMGQVNASNKRNFTAYNVRIAIGISPFLEAGNSTPRLILRDNLTPTETVSVTFPGIVAPGTAIGDLVWVNATLTYADSANRTIGPRFAQQVLTVQAPPALRPDLSSVLAILAFALLAILAAVLVPIVHGERNLAIDEVFLMHRSGILIQHLSRGPALKKDDDLVASMFVAIQEFVRDSFHTKATLDEFSFAGRKAAVLRGQHVVLAALLSRGSPRYLFSQLKAVERSLEQAHGPALVDWDGRASSLDQAGPILEAFLAGSYRRFGGWGR
jgi:hypothetical protein